MEDSYCVLNMLSSSNKDIIIITTQLYVIHLTMFKPADRNSSEY